MAYGILPVFCCFKSASCISREKQRCIVFTVFSLFLAYGIKPILPHIFSRMSTVFIKRTKKTPISFLIQRSKYCHPILMALGAGLPFVFLVCRFMSICVISAQKCTNSAINIDLFLIFLKIIRRDAYEFLRSPFCGEWIESFRCICGTAAKGCSERRMIK